jgi:hypothetical protein
MPPPVASVVGFPTTVPLRMLRPPAQLCTAAPVLATCPLNELFVMVVDCSS